MPLVCRNCGYSRPTSVGDPGAACPVCKAPYPEDDLAAFTAACAARREMSSGVVVAAVVLLACLGVVRVVFVPAEIPPEPTLADQFANARPTAWSDEYHPGIARSLSAYKVRGCGHFRHTPVPGEPGAFLVECSDQRDRKTGYRVTPDFGPQGDVEGPVR